MRTENQVITDVIQILLRLRSNTESYIRNSMNYLIRYHPPFHGSWIGFTLQDPDSPQFKFFKPHKYNLIQLNLEQYILNQCHIQTCLRERQFIYFPKGDAQTVYFTNQTDIFIKLNQQTIANDQIGANEIIKTFAHKFYDWQYLTITQELQHFQNLKSVSGVLNQNLTTKLF
jgi:hypothetical protein